MEKIRIGKIVNAVALKGQVKVYNYSDYKERFEEIDTVIIDDKEYKIENVRYQKDMVVLKLEGIDDRNMSEAMKDKDIYIFEDNLRELPEDTFYIKDLIGIKIVDETTDIEIGSLVDVLQNSAQDLYKVALTKGGETLIPAVEEFVKEINVKDGYIKVKLIPGLLELE
ncbi:MAG: ribosome maturation factor RimM [Anaerovoracaceae bacterium]